MHGNPTGRAPGTREGEPEADGIVDDGIDFDAVSLEEAIGKAAAAAAQDGAANAAEVERMRLWYWLKDSWLLGANIAAPGSLDLVFDTSLLRRRVPDAAEVVIVRLLDGSAIHRTAEGDIALGTALDRFLVRGIGTDGPRVVLKPQRKESGQVVLAFSDYLLFAQDGTPLPIDTFRAWIERYWWP